MNEGRYEPDPERVPFGPVLPLTGADTWILASYLSLYTA